MFRHGVTFRWTPESTAAQRNEALAGLDAFAGDISDLDISDLGRLRVGADAGAGAILGERAAVRTEPA